MTQKPLMKYHCSIQTEDGQVINTWGIYPVLNSTKIMDGIYDPVNKSLKLLFDSIKEDFHQVPMQKENGKYEMQNRRVETYYKGSISEEDITFFLDTYVDNNFDFKYIPEDKKIILE